MIHYLVPRGAEHGMRHFRRTWKHSLADRIDVRFYERPDWRPQGGAVIFADLERLTPEGVTEVTETWNQLKHSSVRLLNNPRVVADGEAGSADDNALVFGNEERGQVEHRHLRRRDAMKLAVSRTAKMPGSSRSSAHR